MLDIISISKGNIFSSLTKKILGDDPKQLICTMILATDMVFHNSLIENFNRIQSKNKSETEKKVNNLFVRMC